MTFYDFIQIMPPQDDKEIISFTSFCKVDASFPKTNDPAKLAIYLYLKLNPQQTTGFQKLLMLYYHFKPENLPKRAFAREDMSLATINLIITLQNASEDYHWN